MSASNHNKLYSFKKPSQTANPNWVSLQILIEITPCNDYFLNANVEIG